MRWLIVLLISIIPTMTLADGYAPMSFSYHQGIVRASGMIWIDTSSKFEEFASQHNIKNKLIVFDSPGGVVHEAIKLGYQIRQLRMTTTVGNVDNKGTVTNGARCWSMCPFLLLAGIHRYVPEGNTIQVHQLGFATTHNPDAIYSRQAIAVAQRDVGLIISYISKMGVPTQLLEYALTTPNWEVRSLTRAEIQRSGLIKR